MTMLRAAAETHTGYVRSTNQDLALVSGDLVAIADGMGGHLGGEVASRTAIEELLEAFVGERSGEGLVTAARRANRAVWRKGRVDRKLHGMGTTLTAAALVARRPGEGVPGGGALGGEVAGDGVADGVTGNGAPGGGVAGPATGEEAGAGTDDDEPGVHVVLVNVGDSRAYVLDRKTNRLRQLTEDHSVVEEMVRQGELTPAEAAVHPHRHVLTRALGIEPEVALDIWDLAAELGSRFLLCSDGLTNEVSDAEIADVLANAVGPEEAVHELVGRALGHGGMDNVTVVVADVVEGHEDPSELPVQLVPPRPPRPEDPVMGTPELTGAIPITEPLHGVGTAGQAGTVAPGPGSVGTEGAAAAAAGTAGQGPPAMGMATSHGRVRDTGHGSGPDTQATSLIDETVAAGAGSQATGGVPVGSSEVVHPGDEASRRRRRKGRSMTLRQRPTPSATDGTLAMDGLGGTTANGSRTDLSGPPSRPVVIVPQRQSKSTRDRIVTVRVALFVLILVGMLGGTLGVIIWFDQSSYFIGLNGDAVAIYQGRPGGMLWFKPQLIETSQVHTHDLLRSSIVTLRSGITESSLHAAELVVGRLKNEKEIALAAATTTTTTTSSTSTTSTTTTTTLPIVVTTVPPTIATTTPTTRADATTTSTSPKKSHPTSTTSPTKVTVTTKPQGN